MKKLIAGLILSIVTVSAQAQHHGWRHHHHHHKAHRDLNWVIPAVITGAVVYAATRPDPVIVQNPPQVIVQPQDIVYINGVAYRKQIMVINGQAQEVLVKL